MTEQPLIAEVSQKAIIESPDGSLLVMQMDETTWELPGGRMGAYEEPVVGLKREIREETGLSVTIDEPIHTAAWRNDQGRGRYSVVYACETEETEVTLSEEHCDYEWVSPETARDEFLTVSIHQAAIDRLLAAESADQATARND
ncbi:NUDIX domain-containing protein [Halonotius terrestris]|uniref:NUDIX domain-containing protein n=1 Tax=Halonotius terrestris TaxID=2487750 RepID=A0A8J8TCN1_9EURY|nr:NUDIX domain-containing protein [Halonotius terrestris]TQQ83678.1 NUDIX domain-containing protein [Halonotius terrestris]